MINSSELTNDQRKKSVDEYQLWKSYRDNMFNHFGHNGLNVGSSMVVVVSCYGVLLLPL